MIISGFKGRNISEDAHIVKMIKDVKPGGLILYWQNISNPEQVKKLISSLQHFSPIPFAFTNSRNALKLFKAPSNIEGLFVYTELVEVLALNLLKG